MTTVYSGKRQVVTKTEVIKILLHAKLHYVVLAGLTTASNSIVLLGLINWEPILAICAGAVIIYGLDNLLDWSGEKTYHPYLKPYWPWYKAATILSILVFFPLCLIATLQHKELVLFLGSLAITSFTQISVTRQLTQQFRSLLALWLERITDALTWAVVTVVSPIVLSGSSFKVQHLMAVGFVAILTFVGVMSWDLTKGATDGKIHPTPTLSDVLGQKAIIKLQRLLCTLAFILSVIDVFLGFFPWHNLVVSLFPLTYLVLLSLFCKHKLPPVFYGALFPISSIILNILTILVYYIF